LKAGNVVATQDSKRHQETDKREWGSSFYLALVGQWRLSLPIGVKFAQQWLFTKDCFEISDSDIEHIRLLHASNPPLRTANKMHRRSPHLPCAGSLGNSGRAEIELRYP
jgi:hypothetical protein